MSRHLYDIEKLMTNDYGKEAIKNKELFETLVQHRSKYTSIRGISYELHTPQTINFIPPAEVTELWKKRLPSHARVYDLWRYNGVWRIDR